MNDHQRTIALVSRHHAAHLQLFAIVAIVFVSFLVTIRNNGMVQQGMWSNFFDTAINSTAISTSSILSTSTIASSLNDNNSTFSLSPESEFQLSDQLPAPIIIPDSQHFEKHTLYICGYDRGDLANHLFPELKRKQHAGLELNTTTTSESPSLLVYGLFGPCPIRRRPKRYDIGLEWISQHFRGKTLSINGEGPRRTSGLVLPTLTNSEDSRYYQMGTPVTTNGSSGISSSVPVLFAALSLIGHYPEKQWQQLFNHSLKPQSTRKHFCIYAVSNCVDFREEAADTISTLFATPGDNDANNNTMTRVVHQGGICRGRNGTLLHDLRWQQKKYVGPVSAKWAGNYRLYKDYRFCLVMENEAVAGYITEKIVNAFLAGCIPIYYGTTLVFDVFSQSAFIYYNISNPAPALARIRLLEDDPEMYRQVVEEAPILAHGSDTIRDYFSLASHVGGGHLQNQIRSMLA